jgi:hypothetical protein
VTIVYIRTNRSASGNGRRAATLGSSILNAALGVGFLVFTLGATAATYRCEADGRVTYSDKPCVGGKQGTVETDDPVDPADRAAAAERRRQEQAQLTQFDRNRTREEQQDLRALALAKKRDADIAKHTTACSKLARRARNAHDDFDIAGPSDQPKARLKMEHADQDFAALCKH